MFILSIFKHIFHYDDVTFAAYTLSPACIFNSFKPDKTICISEHGSHWLIWYCLWTLTTNFTKGLGKNTDSFVNKEHLDIVCKFTVILFGTARVIWYDGMLVWNTAHMWFITLMFTPQVVFWHDSNHWRRGSTYHAGYLDGSARLQAAMMKIYDVSWFVGSMSIPAMGHEMINCHNDSIFCYFYEKCCIIKQ